VVGVAICARYFFGRLSQSLRGPLSMGVGLLNLQ